MCLHNFFFTVLWMVLYAYPDFLDNNLPFWLAIVLLYSRQRLWFSHDDIVVHRAPFVNNYLNNHLLVRWMDREWSTAGPSRSPDLSKIDYWSIQKTVPNTRTQKLEVIFDLEKEKLSINLPYECWEKKPRYKYTVWIHTCINVNILNIHFKLILWYLTDNWRSSYIILLYVMF